VPFFYPTLNPSPQARRDFKTAFLPFTVYGVRGWGMGYKRSF
jgi:hypothetical protein